MHHTGGAWSETRMIYGRIVEDLVRKDWPQHYLSVGLGIGYCEFMVAALSVSLASQRANKNPSFKLLSFESHPLLRAQFYKFLLGTIPEPELAQDETLFAPRLTELFSDNYRLLLGKIAGDSGVKVDEILAFLREKFASGEFQLLGALDNESRNFLPKDLFFNGIIYDAYSSKMSQELWTEEFLSEFVALYPAKKCIFSTYAAKGALTRVLKKSGFDVSKPKGFSGKRESTWAMRDVVL